jgi:hypothetical protein
MFCDIVLIRRKLKSLNLNESVGILVSVTINALQLEIFFTTNDIFK